MSWGQCHAPPALLSSLISPVHLEQNENSKKALSLKLAAMLTVTPNTEKGKIFSLDLTSLLRRDFISM